MIYGVVPTGFSRKPLPVVLDELQDAMVALFGPGVIQTSQSPLGLLNGLFADVTGETLEIVEDTYQSFDVDQAEGPRLDMLGKLRRMKRGDDEGDTDFRVRITNAGQADIKLTANVTRLKDLDGVDWASAAENAAPTTSDKGMPPFSVAYAVVGGDDEEVGAKVYQLSVPGIALYGNTEISLTIDGFCRPVRFIRPIDVPIRVEIDVRHVPDACNCAPPSIGTIQEFVIAAFAGTCGYRNGDTVSKDRVAVEAARIGDLKIVEVRVARASDLIVMDEIETTLFERPIIDRPYLVVRYV